MTGAIIEKGNTDAGPPAKSSREFVITRVFDAPRELTEYEGKTTLTLSGFPINATEEARKTFEGGFDGVRQGFKGTLDQLADYLVSQSGKSR
jgi:uncharacterized protein YndB with AHSA1/START domain